MKKLVCAIYDSKMAIFSPPMIFMRKPEALRVWADGCNDEKTAYYKHPEDYTFFELGSYDEEKGTFENVTTPVSLGLALEYKRPGVSETPTLKAVGN